MVAAAVELGLAPIANDDRGVPHLLRATNVAPVAALNATDAALKHLGQLAPAWGVARTALPTLQGIGEVPSVNGTIVRVRQTIDGLPVHRGEMRVMVRPSGDLVATSGVLVSAGMARRAPSYPIDDTRAVALALEHQYQKSFDPSALAAQGLRSDGSRMISGRQGNIDVQLARAQRMWHQTGNRLEAAWVVEAYAGDASSTAGDAFRTVLSADGQRVISHRSLISDAAFTYRVWAETSGEFRPADGPIADYSPHPTGTPGDDFPEYVAPSLVTVEGLNHPANQSSPDPWLLDTRTETLGNNVDVYSDVNPPTGFTFGDFRATLTSLPNQTTPGAFDRVYDTSASPLASQAQQMAGITSAFYGINWLHDFWYDAGFTEAAGNAQDNNFGRGGEDRDAMIAETQDNFPNSLNNANMATPSDGLPPRMQIFVWLDDRDRNLSITPVGGTTRTPQITSASFGPFTFTANNVVLALAADGVTNDFPGGTVTDACSALMGTYTGMAVLVDRGACSFRLKAQNVQAAGGVAVIIANNQGTTPPGMGNDATLTTPINIGVFGVTMVEGAAIKTELAGGAVLVSMHRTAKLLDGSLDSTLLAHEFGHYLHHRLQDCTTSFCSAESEGWGDFLALMSMMREGDSGGNYDGAYPFSIYSTQSGPQAAYFGIRRVPFSVNQAKNSLSYRHMADGVALPTNHPFSPGGPNSEVHNAGEVWAQTMQEVYVALLKAQGASFTAARTKMAKYVVSALLMAPKDSTPPELREAFLAVADPGDRMLMLEAFSRRGLGSCATAPLRTSSTFVGIQESNLIIGNAVVSPSIGEADSCDDDGVLDAGEAATLSVPLTNRGHKTLTDVKVSVTVTNPAIQIAPKSFEFKMVPAGESKELKFNVTLDKGTNGMIPGDFKIKVDAGGNCVDTYTQEFPVRINVDNYAESASNDNFDATSNWTPTETTAAIWQQVTEGPLDRAWHGENFGSTSDERLESPTIMVGTAPFKVSFTHRYKFEISGTTAFDGGVIEYTKDNGTTWADVRTLLAADPYTHTLTAGTSNNPLRGKRAFGGQSAAYPAPVMATLDFGTQLAGQSVKLRFRIGTDQGVGDEGWRIDDLVFEGVVNKPFPTLGEDRAADCGVTPPQPPPDDLPGCCDTRRIRSSNLALALGVLGLLVLRRRRRR